MIFKTPTYEEYVKATAYARIRYRFGVYIQLIAVLLLLYLLFYTITNIEEMKANPRQYAEDKLGVICFSPGIQESIPLQNGRNRSIENIKQG